MFAERVVSDAHNFKIAENHASVQKMNIQTMVLYTNVWDYRQTGRNMFKLQTDGLIETGLRFSRTEELKRADTPVAKETAG